MDNQAFDIILNLVEAELKNQGFDDAVELKEEDGNAKMYVLDDLAYSLKYEKNSKSFLLRSSLMEEEKVRKWKNLSKWMFDEETDGKAEAESIANDFLEIIRGPKRVEFTKKAASKKKKDERNIDELFFFNRLVGYFPELKDLMNKDRIEYGKIRYATLIKSNVVPQIENMAVTKDASLQKMITLLDDMYFNGDLDVRAMVIHGIYNSLSGTAMANIQEHFSEGMVKVYKCSKGLKNKKIKPEKEKKKSQFMANAMENAKALEKEKKANSR